MVNKVVLTLEVTPEERQRIEELARQRGYSAPDEYLLALVESDSAARQTEVDLDTKAGILVALRESLHQAITGDTRPISELWDALEEDE
jgi:hypothetical protein